MDILSQIEIDDLLDALSTGKVQMNDLQDSQKQKDHKLYDFRRPNKFSKEHLRTLQILHSGFARILSNVLTGYLRSNIQIEVASVDQLTFEDFIHSIPTPSVLIEFSLNPLKGTAIAQLDPVFLFPMIDLFFGGNGEAPKDIRDLTDIELSVARKLTIKILDNLALAWKDIVQVKPAIESVETNPHLHQVYSFNEIVALISFATQVGESAKGFINLCFPFTLLDPVISHLTLKRHFGPEASDLSGLERKKMVHWLGQPSLELTVLAGQTWVNVNEFLHLREGDVLLLDRRVDQDMDMYIEEQMKFKVQAGKLGSQLAVQITALAEGEKDV
ncbi:MAG: flagellar motor switch protein FliM [Desulfotomaculaceae bacterium]|nr:flagellar motor switch protein FliM [Desulfotomaculaceae bacterium]